MLKKFYLLLALAFGLVFGLGWLSLAQAADASAPKMNAEEFVASLKFQTGKITLPGNIATLNLPSNFRYLPPADAERVLVQGWGNPPGNPSLGMIFPAELSPLAEDGWGVVITYDKDGHVKDDDADSIKYDDLLKEMKEATLEASKERKKDGYGGIELVGWAEPPRYDKTSHKFFWAKELKFGDSKAEGNSLNYNIRVLGREGVLVLNAVATMKQLSTIKTEMPQIVEITNFTAGNSYNDFDSKTDKVAEYGLAALVAGGVAAKLGFFGKIFAFLLAFKKLLFIGLIAIGAGVMKLLGRNK